MFLLLHQFWLQDPFVEVELRGQTRTDVGLPSLLPHTCRVHYLVLVTEVHAEHLGVALRPFDPVEGVPRGCRLLC